MEKSKKDLLSKEFKVAAQIYECNDKNETVWFTELAELLKDDMSPTTTMKALRTLVDWNMVKAQYGPTPKGRAGRLLFIAGESKETIKEIYEKFWKNR